ncbi:MAG: hypothetical protein Q9162_005518 [Coniocarpon cinnabarinum]
MGKTSKSGEDDFIADIKKNAFTLDAEPSALISDVRKQVAEHESTDVSQIRLIYSGKVLVDDKTVESYGIKDTDHIISMVSKPKPQPAPPAAPATPAQPSTAQTPAAPAPASGSAPQNAPSTPTPAGATTSAERRFDDTSPLMGPQRQAAIAEMESMGFERPQIERAMRAAFFNPDRAVEFLFGGIPENISRELDAAQSRQQGQQQGQGQGQGQQQQQQPATATTGTAPAAAAPPTQPASGEEPVNLFEQAAAQSQGARSGGGGSGGAATGAAARGAGAGAGAGGLPAGAGLQNLDFLRENPMFQQLRQLVQAQPSMLESVLHQVSAANPQLAQLISQHPQQFLEMLTEGGDGEGMEGVQLPPGARDISVTEDERDAIERLCNLGFERDLVIQAYFACDKNEELAANFLFDNQREEDDGTGGAA